MSKAEELVEAIDDLILLKIDMIQASIPMKSYVGGAITEKKEELVRLVTEITGVQK